MVRRSLDDKAHDRYTTHIGAYVRRHDLHCSWKGEAVSRFYVSESAELIRHKAIGLFL